MDGQATPRQAFLWALKVWAVSYSVVKLLGGSIPLVLVAIIVVAVAARSSGVAAASLVFYHLWKQ